MADRSRIEWTDTTWNPTTGCDRISAGCDNCYALKRAKRLQAMGSDKYRNDGDPRTSGPGFGLTVHPDTLETPLHWRKPRKIFVNSMSDLFHARVPRQFIASVFAVMAATPQHTYQILTKRPKRMADMLTDECRCGSGHMNGMHFRSEMEWAATPHSPTYVPGLKPGLYHRMKWPLSNVILGTSVESQELAGSRIPHLLRTPAAVRMLSCEPLLGPVDLTRIAAGRQQQPDMVYDALGQRYGVPGAWQARSSARVDWVVVGGESGHGARPMHPDWARQLRDQSADARVPFFFKQTGTVLARELGIPGKGDDFDLLPEEFRIREFPRIAEEMRTAS